MVGRDVSLERARRILLIGGDGQVGWELRRTLAPLGQLRATTRTDADLREPADVARLVEAADADAVVLAAAYTDVDGAEVDRATAFAVNADAPGAIARACRRRGTLLVHFSTDYVFDGGSTRPYDEADPTAPLGVYGESKRAGEVAIEESGCAALVFRSSWIYGDRGRNFLRTILRLARERDELRIVDDQIGAPTWSRLLAEAAAAVLARALAQPGFALDSRDLGIYHLSAAGETTWYGFAAAILEALPDPERRATAITPIRTQDFPRPARRPPYSVLDNTRIAQRFGIRLPHWHDQLHLLLAQTAGTTDTLPPNVP